ncbi:MAG TPA: hypothetical protein VMY40_01980 [Anaerolineae bacterium]|nr:hypothetical protein [Anaerolineae bacterium]
MRGERLRQAKKHARRVLRVWREASDGVRSERWYEPGGDIERRMRYCRVPCSGPCCGNPRRHHGKPTLQERKADERLRAELEALGLLRT